VARRFRLARNFTPVEWLAVFRLGVVLSYFEEALTQFEASATAIRRTVRHNHFRQPRGYVSLHKWHEMRIGSTLRENRQNWWKDMEGNTMAAFVGVIDGGGESWRVRFPDLEGCVGAGASPEEAIASPTEALREVMSYRRSGGFNLVKPRTLAEILERSEVDPGESTALVPLLLDAGRVVRPNLTFDAGLLEAIDETARDRGLTRSAFLASAAREKIAAQR